jgi:hypothetical protein
MKGCVELLRGWLTLSYVACLVLTSSACSEIQSKYVAIPIDSQGRASPKETTKAGLVLSGEELFELSSPSLGVIEVTFENHSTRWLHVRDVTFSFGSDAVNQSILMPGGADLEAWADTAVFSDAIRPHSSITALSRSARAVAGSLATRPSRAAGTSPYAAPLSVAQLVALRTANDNSPLDALRVPAEHLLASPITVPPGLFAKRWLLLYTPDSQKTGCLRRMQLGYRLDDGQVEYVSLTFRDPKSHSPWQFAVCFS